MRDSHMLKQTIPKDVVLLVLALVFLAFFILFFAPPRHFPQETYIEIEKGQSVLAIAKDLREDGYIRSEAVLTNIIVSQDREDSVVAGFYYFDEPISVFEVARRIITGDQKFKPVRVTIPEGTSVLQMADIIDVRSPNSPVGIILKAIDILLFFSLISI